MNRVARQLIYGFTAMWLIVASIYRVILMVTKGQDIDALPFISVCIGVVLLASLLIDNPNRNNRSDS